MRSFAIGARRPHAGLAAAAVLSFLGLSLTPAAADGPTAEEIQSDSYLMARLRAGQSWDSGALSIGDLKPGAVDQVQLESYVQHQQAAAPAIQVETMEMLAALGPQVVTEAGDTLMLQTASATWGDPGLMPRSRMGADGVWEFPRRPDHEELEMLSGQPWRIVESVESQILFFGPDRHFGWDDFADLVNPLQHVPLVNIAYRAISGDKIYGAASLIDVAFGPLSGMGTVFQLAYESTTGQSLEDQAVAAVFGRRANEDVAGLYSTASRQLADRLPVRRGSNE